MVLPVGIGPCIPPTPSPNKYGRGVVSALSHVGTTASSLIMPSVGLRAFPGGTSNSPQYPLPRPLLCSKYPPPNNVWLPLSWHGTHSGCDQARRWWYDRASISCKDPYDIRCGLGAQVSVGGSPAPSGLETWYQQGLEVLSMVLLVGRRGILVGNPHNSG